MNASHHSLRVRLALAAAGIASFAALAVAAWLVAGSIGGARGILAGVLLIGAASGGCGLVSSGLPRKVLHPARPVTEPHDTPEFPELIKTPVLG